MKLIETDIVIIGAGPVGLFTVFEAGLLGLNCHLIDNWIRSVVNVLNFILINQFMIFLQLPIRQEKNI